MSEDPTLGRVEITYQWRGRIDDGAVEALHAAGFGHAPVPTAWGEQLARHSLGWVCAYDGDELVGFVNVAWDGGSHAFVLDTLVAERARRRGMGTRLVAMATEEARKADCEWLHVDFDPHLRSFYLEACGFTPADSGLIEL